MKLITEYRSNSIDNIIRENKETRKREYVLAGIFLQADKKNLNGRIYPRDVMEKACAKFIEEQVVPGRAVGELNHPDSPVVNLDKVSHRITSLKWDGDDVIGEALVLDTPNGQIVKSLIDGGVKLGISSRGMGTLIERNQTTYVDQDYDLCAIDIVQNPSAPDAFVNGILEGISWDKVDGQLIERFSNSESKRQKSIVADRFVHEVGIRQQQLFKDFLSKI